MIAERLQLCEQGIIGLYQNPNERFWRVRDGKLQFLDATRRVTTEYIHRKEFDGQLLIVGYFRENSETLHILEEVAHAGE